MNVLELLQAYLQRASVGGGSPQIFLSEEEALPPRDPQVLAPGQEIGGLAAARGMGGGLHSNALGIYAAPRPPPAGDVVLPSGDRGLAIPWMPRPSGEEASRAGNVMTTPSYLPGPGGSTRISASSSLNQFMPPALPLSLEEQAAFMRRPPLASGVGTATPPTAWFEDTPFNMTGGYSKGRNLRETSEPFNMQQFMYRRNFPF